jgi:CHAT domain-containing protein
VVDPNGDLPFAEVEAAGVAAHFPPEQRRMLSGPDATREAVAAAVAGRAYVHFACHGYVDWHRPASSPILLAGEDLLTVTQIGSDLDLSAARLVVLSACESGVINFQGSPEEEVGFPSALLQGGAPGVVSTLWEAPDVSTGLLLGRFYRHHVVDRLAPVVALQRAQSWLRTAIAGELGLDRHWESVYLASGRRDAEALRKVRYYRANPGAVPFEDPYFWAPFTLTGW